ncbi:hypothetical protein [Frigoribacterium sp. VKM Ac-2530]|uniref:hypothetical protein n=1 Tax=Frigoribacterium sp. VKM Ac-2530 TaxID=2783822 RepID=UPI00188D45BC|nr:hypothetical protein [Frigoribacterium sp. VKM Ac-2530]MBF4578663.1 hypothetical protein [Frigoribacterium sp. VKM Ac-2530]
MPDVRRKRGQRATTRRRLAVAGIGAFVLVDLALVAVALTAEPAGLAADRAPVALPSSLPSEPAAEPTPTVTTPAPAVAPTRALSAVDAETAWRSQAGSCAPGGTADDLVLESTTSGGGTWSATSVSSEAALAGVDRLQATAADTVFVVGPAGAGCTPSFAQTFTGGAEFRDYPDRLAAAWFVSRTSTSTVHSPAGDRPAPCAVIDLAVAGDARAAVLCGDGTVHRTVDSASTWDAGTAVQGAVALTSGAGGYLVAASGAAGCDGVAISSVVDSATAVAPLGCAPATVDAPGAVAVSAAAGSLWLWAGDAVLVSADGGRTW